MFAANIWLYPNTNLETFQDLPSTFSNNLFEWIGTPLANKIAFCILILTQAFTVNAIVSHFKLAKQFSFIPAVCYILIHFSYVDIDSCTPVLVANTFMLWALFSLFSSYDKRVEMGTIFNVGFSVAVATLFYHGHVVFFVWIIMSLLIVRSFDPQEFIVLIMGFFVPFFLLGTYHFIGDNLGNWWQNDLMIHYKTMNSHITYDLQLYLLMGILAISFLLAASNLQGLYFKTTSKEKKFINIVFLMPVIAMLSFFFQNELYSYHYVIFFVPISILLAITLQSYKSQAATESIHFIIFMICMGIQFQAFFFQ